MAEAALMQYGWPKPKKRGSNLVSGDLIGRRWRPRRPSVRKLAKGAAIGAVCPPAGVAYAVSGDLVGRRLMKKIKKAASKTVKKAASAATSKPGMFAIGMATGGAGTIAVQQVAKSGIVGKTTAKVKDYFTGPSAEEQQIAELQKQLAARQAVDDAAIKAAQDAAAQNAAAEAAQREAAYKQQIAALQAQQQPAQVQSVAPVLQTVAATVPNATVQKAAQVYTDIPATAQTVSLTAAKAADVLGDLAPMIKKYMPFVLIGGAGLLAWKILK